MPLSFKQSIKDFIDDIPDEKLTGLPLSNNEIHSTRNYSLSMQSLTTPKDEKQFHILVIIISGSTTISTARKGIGQPMAIALVPTDGSWSATQVKDKLREREVKAKKEANGS